MPETVEFHNTEFTFKRVESINELPRIDIHVTAKSHEEALEIFFRNHNKLPLPHIDYWQPQKPLKHSTNIYALTICALCHGTGEVDSGALDPNTGTPILIACQCLYAFTKGE